MIEERIRKMTQERLELAKKLRFYDCNLWLGRPEGFPLAEEILPERVSEVLEKRLVTGGLVSHWRGKTVSAQQGNESVLQDLRGQSKDLFAVWTGLPLFPAELGPVPGSTETPKEVRGVRIFPKSHHFPLTEWCIGSLCEWLIARRMPLFIWHTELDWPPMYQIAKTFPKLSIVIETQVQKILYHIRPLFLLMRDCRNVLLEISNFVGPGYIEYAAREFGAERLIFGSFLPVNDPFVAMGMVLDSEVPEEQKTLIAGGNLRRLVSEVRI
jgi:hypothetical protein